MPPPGPSVTGFCPSDHLPSVNGPQAPAASFGFLSHVFISASVGPSGLNSNRDPPSDASPQQTPWFCSRLLAGALRVKRRGYLVTRHPPGLSGAARSQTPSQRTDVTERHRRGAWTEPSAIRAGRSGDRHSHTRPSQRLEADRQLPRQNTCLKFIRQCERGPVIHIAPSPQHTTQQHSAQGTQQKAVLTS